MANEDDRFGQAQIALMVWLGLAGLITVLLLLSYYFNQKGKKKKESKSPFIILPNAFFSISLPVYLVIS